MANMHYHVSQTLHTLLLFATYWHGLLRHNTSANFRSSCFDRRYKHGTREPLSIYDSYLYRMSLLSCPCDIRKKKVIVSFLRRASCNNCCARQFVKCRQQVFLMAHPLLCIRSPAAGAIDFFDGRSIVEKAWW